MGSNPIPSIECSVRSLENQTKKESEQANIVKKKQSNSNQHCYVLDFNRNGNVGNIECRLQRDIYNRQEKVRFWKNKARNELKGSDLIDVFKLIEHMEDNESSSLWIVRCITALLSLRRQLNKPFKDASKEDIRKLLKWMDIEKNYKASTIEKLRTILKWFYKVVYGNNEEYPESVKWFSVNVGKEKMRQEKRIDIEKYLEEEEIKKLVEHGQSLEKKAFIACMYESGARPEEFLTLSNKDIMIDTIGVVFILRGKTGERRVRIIAYAKLLQQWLEIHPLKQQSEYPLWISEATNYKNRQLGLRGAEKIISTTMQKAGILNKQTRLYILRHSRATHLSKYLTEAQMCTMFGWRLGTKVIRNYIHLSGKDVDNVLISLNENGKVVQDEYLIKPLKCVKCGESISPSSNFCGKCALPIKLSEQVLKDNDLEEENKILAEKLSTIETKMNEKFNQIMMLINQNPILARFKTEVLMNKVLSDNT